MSERSLLKAVSSVLSSREPGGSSESRDSQTTVKSLYSLKVVEMLPPEACASRIKSGTANWRLRRNAAVILAFWALSTRQNVTQWSLPPCCCRFVRSWLVAGAARINSAKVVFRSRATGEGEVETAAGLDCANKPMLKTRTKTMNENTPIRPASSGCHKADSFVQPPKHRLIPRETGYYRRLIAQMSTGIVRMGGSVTGLAGG